MSFLHTFNIDALKQNFDRLIEIDELIFEKKNNITNNLNKLKTTYNSLVKYNSKKIFLFCLDSFYFQYKILNMEMENLTKFIILINNRMYGDYYKLYNIIMMQNKEKNIQIPISPDIKKMPIYKDLEPFHEYKIDDIKEIHKIILQIIDDLHLFYEQSEKKIHDYADNTNVGISITNFLTTLEYENTMLREQMGLYINYIHFFHSSQENYLAKLYTKMDMFYREIEEDILNNNQTTELNTKNNVESFFLLSHELIDLNLNSDFQKGVTTKNDKIESILSESEQILECSEKIFETIETIDSFNENVVIHENMVVSNE